MERSRSKRSYHYDQDSDSPPRSRTRYDNRRSGGGYNRRGGGGDRRGPQPLPPPPPLSLPPPPPLPPVSSKIPDDPPPATTIFRILCPAAAAAIGKSGAAIKSIRQETGADIAVLPLVQGDDERIVETSDDRRREPDGRPPQYSPAQEALLLIHEQIVDELEEEEEEEEDGYSGGGGWGGMDKRRGRERGRITTRLVVPRIHVGCLLGKGGKIIEQMRMETKTHIRILPRDQFTPRCVSAAEEIVQVVGEGIGVKKAVAIISSRLKESLHRDRGPFRGQLQSPDHYFPPDDDFMNNVQHRPALEGPDLGSRSSARQARVRTNAYGSEYTLDQDADPISDLSRPFPYEDTVFRILCPNSMIEKIIGSTEGIIELLHEDVGVGVRITDPMPGSDERIISITSEEGPDDELFPAQEALLHIQTHIVDLGPDRDSIIKTRLLVSSADIGCLEGRDEPLSEIRRVTSANVQILPKENLPPGATEADWVVQIVGELRPARDALVHVTEKLRSYLYCDTSTSKDLLPSSIPTPSHTHIPSLDSGSPIRNSSPYGYYQGNNPPLSAYQNIPTAATSWQLKDNGRFATGSLGQEESIVNDVGRQSGPKRFSDPFVTKSTLEVIIPQHAVPLLTGSKLAQISEISGANVTLVEDRPEQTEKVVQISGSPEQAETARSLLRGLLLQ